MLLRLLLVAMLLPSALTAQSLHYDHNGSTVQIAQVGRQVSITYLAPRPGLIAEGVGAGTLLFSGTLDANNYLSGMARMFRKGCGLMDYYVYGDYQSGQDFQLTGAAPILAPQGCRVVNNSMDVANGTLQFFAVSSSKPVPSSATGHGRFCVTGVRLGGTLNLRSGPGTGYGVLDQIPATSCQIIGAAPPQFGWQPVSHSDRPGWVAIRFLQRVE